MESLESSMALPSSLVKDIDFYVLLDSHIPYFLSHPQTKTIVIPGLQAERFKGDFHGLLNYLALDKKLHYLITRMNNLFSSSDYAGEETSITLPDPSIVSRVISTFSTVEN